MNKEYGGGIEHYPKDSAFFLKDSYDAISEMRGAVSESPEDLIVQSTRFIDWASTVNKMGMNVYGISENSHVAFKLASPVLDAAQTETIDESWIDLFKGYKSVAVEKNEGIPIRFRGQMPAYLERLEEFTGVDFEVLLNHAPFLYKWALRRAIGGLLIVSINDIYGENREYNVWESRYNRRRGNYLENEMVDSISDALLETITLPVLPKNY